MPQAPLNALSFFGVDKPTLAYRTNTSPVNDSPHWILGSQNIMGTIKGEIEKRPGFATPIETMLSNIPGTVRRLYRWRRFSGSFFVMASVETATPGALSQVWKLEVGVDQSFSVIYSDATSTASHPFDFVTSNNFVFFGNQTTRQNMRKYNGTAISDGYRASLWGLDFPVAAPSEVLTSPTLPPGLTFSGGTLSGTPVTPGTYSIAFTAADTHGDTATQSMNFTITDASLDWKNPSAPLPFAELGTVYSDSSVQAWGGIAPYSYAVQSGFFPPSLSLDGSTGAISGTPTLVGDYSFAITATDSASNAITRVFTLFVGNPSISIAGPAPLTGTVGAAYSSSITPLGGTAPYTFIAASGSFPSGMVLDALGNLNGTPSISGVYSVTFQVTDALGVSNQSTSTFTISSNVLSISTVPAPPIAKIGYAYSYTPFASGGTNSATATSGAQTVSGDWQLVGTQYRTISEPVVTSLNNLVFRSFPLAVPPSATILGVEVSTDNVSQASTTGEVSQVALFSAGVQIGTIKTPNTPFTTTVTPATYGDSTDLWGASLTTAIVNDPSFGFAEAVNLPDTTRLFIGQPWKMTVYYAITSSSITVTASPDAITAQTGYIYGQTFTSIYGHESSMSMLSSSTGIFTDLAVKVNVLSSADLQVNGINLYRTTDGGDADPAAMRLLSSLANTDATFVDSTQDIYLGLQTGPALYVNDPPQPLDGLVWSNGRIWGRNASKTWFTGNEEVTNGIPEECMSDAINGNFYAWPSQVGGMAVTSNGVNIGVSEQFWQVSGDGLSTFRKSKLLQGGGTRFPINIISVGDDALWLDTAKQAFSSSEGEFGEPIRPDIANLDLSQSFIVYHKSKIYNWTIILDGANSLLYIFDNDLNQWNPPWKISGGATAITSGETSVGEVNLLVAFADGHVCYLTPGTYNDDGAEYGETMKSNLLSVIPGRGSSSRNAAEVRQIAQFDMEISKAPVDGNDFLTRSPEFFACLVDDDPTQSTQEMFFDLSGNITDPQYQDQTIQKRFIGAKRWMVDQAVPHARRVAFMAQWDASDQPWTLYTWDLAWRT